MTRPLGSMSRDYRPGGNDLRASSVFSDGHHNDRCRQTGLCAVFLSAFLIDALGHLQEDPTETTLDILIHQTRMMHNATLGPFEPLSLEPPAHVGLVNPSICKPGVHARGRVHHCARQGWIQEFDRGLISILVMRNLAVIREYRAQGLERYKLPQIIALLPLLLYTSLVLFICGLIILRRPLQPRSSLE